MAKMNRESVANFLCDFFPLAVFFIFYKLIGSNNPLVTATVALIIATLIALIISYFLTKKVAKVAIFSGVVLSLFGMATVLLKNDIFIKIKPTVINSVFAAVLFYCYFAKKSWLSSLFGSKINISNDAWRILSLRWAIFFMMLALLNELIWRNFSTDFWVQFKVFGMTPISLIFMLSQMPFLMREMAKLEKKG